MKVGARSTTGWRATISVAMSNYIEAGSIIAIATSLTFWQDASASATSPSVCWPR